MDDTNLTNTLRTAMDEALDAKQRFGVWLKDAREQAGLSVDAVSHETKISKNYILSLESGNIDALPGKVFGRGFVKCITRLLKSDGVEGLRLYDACWGSNIITASTQTEEAAVEVHKTKSVMARIAEPVNISSPVTQRLMGGGFSPAGERPSLPSVAKSGSISSNGLVPKWLIRAIFSPYVRMWVLGAIATVFVGLIFGRWAASHWHKARLNGGTKAVATAPAVTKTLNQVAASGVTTEAELTGLEAVNNTPSDINLGAVVKDSAVNVTPSKILAKNEDNPLYMPSESVGAFEQVLEFKVSNPVEIRLTLDGKKVENTWFKTDSYRFTFNDKAELYLLDASEVDVSYNGKSLGVLGNKGRKRRIYFQAKATSGDFIQ